MYLSIILLPFLGSAFAGLRGRALGTTGSQIVTTTCIFLTTIMAIVAFYEVGLSGSPVSVNIGTWLDSEPLIVNWAFLFDDLTVSMLLPVLVVSSLVHLYSINYIADDPHNQRFFSYLSFFTASIVILVTGDSYAVLFLGWEGIGIASFLLIGFWITRVQANKAAIKALTVNRVGDSSLSVGLFALL
jgi:NADH-ubiquinone oxidoreductase chain 5